MNKKRMPKISVICPTYNSSKYIEKTLTALLKQEKSPFEIIISDDGSTDNTLELLEKWADRFTNKGINLRILSNAHQGPGGNRNAAINVAQGDWLAFLDSDDIWSPKKIIRVEQSIIEKPERNFIVHWEEYHGVNGFCLPIRNGSIYDLDRPLPPQLYRVNGFSTSAVTCRRDLVVWSGGFDPSFPIAQDYEFWLRLSPQIHLVVIEEILGYYIERSSSITARPYYKRYPQIMRILWKHRDKADIAVVGWRMFKVTMSHRWFLMIYRLIARRQGHIH